MERRVCLSSYLQLVFAVGCTCVSVLSAHAQETGREDRVEREIAVTADALSISAPDTAEISILLRQNGANAASAYQAVEASAKKLRAAVLAAGATAQVRERGEHFAGTGQDAGVITPSATVQAERQMVIETSDLPKVASIIDTALQNGASEVLDVSYSCANDTAVRAAIVAATEKAKVKAELVARTLGVGLGPLLSSVVTEEPEGATVRRAMQQGGDLQTNGERAGTVFVSLRYQTVAK